MLRTAAGVNGYAAGVPGRDRLDEVVATLAGILGGAAEQRGDRGDEESPGHGGAPCRARGAGRMVERPGNRRSGV